MTGPSSSAACDRVNVIYSLLHLLTVGIYEGVFEFLNVTINEVITDMRLWTPDYYYEHKQLVSQEVVCLTGPSSPTNIL